MNDEVLSGSEVVGGEAKEETPRSGGSDTCCGEWNDAEVVIGGEATAVEVAKGGEAGFDLNDPNDFCLFTPAGP